MIAGLYELTTFVLNLSYLTQIWVDKSKQSIELKQLLFVLDIIQTIVFVLIRTSLLHVCLIVGPNHGFVVQVALAAINLFSFCAIVVNIKALL